MSGTPSRLEHAVVLLAQGRHDLAERELRGHLAADPDDAEAHAVLALCLLADERMDEARTEAEAAIALEPGLSLSHEALARVHLERDAPNSALGPAREAVALDPDRTGAYGVLAATHLALRQWQQAVDVVDHGLRLDPQHDGLLSIRGLATTHLGDRAAATVAFDAAMRRNPENTYAHASRALMLQHAGQHREAMEGYREALRLDPTNDMAREGLVEALKARNPVYGLFLRWSLWTSRLSGRATLFVFVGFYVAQRLLRELARSEPALAPIIGPVLIAYLVVAWFTFTASPIFNLILWLDPIGRHALSREQRVESGIVGALVAVGLPAAAIAIVTDGSALPSALAVLGLGLVVPLAGRFASRAGWPQRVMTGVVIVIAAVGALGVLAAITGNLASASIWTGTCLVLVVLSSWLAAPMAMVRRR